MTTTPTIETATLDKLFLDAHNPRLGRHEVEDGLSPDAVLKIMQDWSLEELAVSFLESGFWPQEALIAIHETVDKKKDALVVVEGNRRLAALKMIDRVRSGQDTPNNWKEIVKGYPKSAFTRLENIPYILQPNRESVTSYLGYRHVTGIKEWNPAEKAQFIAHLVEDEKLSYEQVRKRIGSKAPAVRRNYISYRLLLQMENDAEGIDLKRVEDRFSVLYLSLRTNGVQKYLQIDIDADPKAAKRPVPKARLEQLANFARWLFGVGDRDPIFTDSRQVDEFGRVLESKAAVDYLERSPAPSFSVARRIAGVAESEVAQHIELASDEVEEALKAVHQHKASTRVQHAVKRLGADTFQLLRIFPLIKAELLEEDS